MSGHIFGVFIIVILLAIVNKKWAVFTGFIILLWMFSFRTDEVPDTSIYQWMYDDPQSRLDYNEIGYLYLGLYFQMLTGADYIVFYIALVALCLTLWYFSTRLLLEDKEHYGIIFLIFLSFYGFFYLGITTRNFLSEVIVLCGLVSYCKIKGRNKTLIYVIAVTLAMLIHRSAAFFIILLPLASIHVSKKGYYRIFAICVFLWLLSGSSVARGIVGLLSNVSMFSKLDNYASSTESAPSMFSLQILINWVVSFIAIKARDYIEPKYSMIYNLFLKINMIGLFTLSLIWSIPTSYRFYNMFFFYNYILIYIAIFHCRILKVIHNRFFLSISISIIYFLILIHCFPIILFY